MLVDKFIEVLPTVGLIALFLYGGLFVLIIIFNLIGRSSQR